MKPLFAALLPALMLVAQTTHAQVRCPETIDAKLAQLNVQKSSVKEITTIRFGTKEGGLQGYRGWVRLSSCRGYLVIDLTTDCLVTTFHTTGTCRALVAPSH